MTIGTRERLATEVLHTVARVALRFQSPIAARRLINRLARLLPAFADIEVAQAAQEGLALRGSCLSRSLTISARLPGSDVVIGVDPRRSAQLHAHAWVSSGGKVVDRSGRFASEEQIARL